MSMGNNPIHNYDSNNGNCNFMVIRLTLQEIWVLQDVKANRKVKDNITKWKLMDIGLIKIDDGYEVFLTDIGLEVLRKHLPISFRENIYP